MTDDIIMQRRNQIGIRNSFLDDKQLQWMVLGGNTAFRFF